MVTQEIKTDQPGQVQAQHAFAFEDIYESFLERERSPKQFVYDEERHDHLLINNWWAN